MIAYCGLDCEKCEAFLATRANDDGMRARVAEEWGKQVGVPLKPEHINCTGCYSAGVKTYYCEALCEIRKCAIGRSLSTCAPCADFPCGRLQEIFKHKPQAREALELLRSK